MATAQARRFFVQPADVDTMVMDFGWVKWTHGPSITGGSRYSCGHVYILPGWGHEQHIHPGVEEVLYFIQGSGIQVVGEERTAITPGLTVFIPPDVPHSTLNDGAAPLEFLAIYSPPGTEEALREQEGVAIIPAGSPLTSPSFTLGLIKE